ncbi:MAG: hypothetical protein K9J13_03125 [Saprospiraceae bacterium]|nr:hypothetical protein [Saprospiraceae bacterium]
MRTIINKSIPFILLIIILIVFLIISFLSEGYEGGADNLAHFLYSKQAFNHPKLFLHHWGKPFFILLSSPFAQFGFNGIKVFNIIIGLLTALFTYLIAKELKFKNACLVIVFVSFTPIYFILHFTALTEILFSFVLILSIYLVLKNKYIISAIILSFLIFTRTEGIVILPLFWVFYLSRKKYLSILLTSTAFILYGIIGYFYFHDFFWFITQMPYGGAKDIYGSGSLFHFIDSSKSILGIPLSILFIFGLLIWIFNFIKQKQKKSMIFSIELLLIILPAIAYFSAHSVAWWLGKGGSLGLIRVIAAVTPLMVLLSLKGFNFMQDLIPWKLAKLALSLIIIVLVVMTSVAIYTVPVKLTTTEIFVKDICTWFENSEYNKSKIFYYDPHFWFFTGLDPYDKTTNTWMLFQEWPDKEIICENSILFWDSHFGPNEGRQSLDDLKKDKRFEQIKVFKPKQNFKVLGGYDYEMHVFKHKPYVFKVYNSEVDSLINSTKDKTKSKLLEYRSFENDDYFKKGEIISDSISFSGKNSLVIDGKNIFPLSKSVVYCDMLVNGIPLKIKAGFRFLSETNFQENIISIVISYENDGETYEYHELGTEKNTSFRTNEWNKLETELDFKNVKSPNDKIKVNLWHRGKNKIFIDDFYAIVYFKEE